jgi:hypothetical protein
VANYYFTHEDTPLGRLALDGRSSLRFPIMKDLLTLRRSPLIPVASPLWRAIRASPRSVISNSPCTGNGGLDLGVANSATRLFWKERRPQGGHLFGEHP